MKGYMSKTQKQTFLSPDALMYIRSIHTINDYGILRLGFLGNNNKNEYHVEREFDTLFLQEENGMLAQAEKLLRIKPNFNFKYIGKIL